MNNLKKKVFASAAMLLVAAVMMTGSSFAWYTISTQGDIAKVKVKMEAHDSVEIAIKDATPGEINIGDTGDQRTWGSLANFDENYTILDQLATYIPSNETEEVYKTYKSNPGIYAPTYGPDGRLADDLVKATVSTAATYDDDGATPAILATSSTATKEFCCARYDFWIRTNNLNDLYINDDGSEFNGDASMTVKFADAEDNVIGTWTSGSTPQITIDNFTLDGTGQNADYHVEHIYMYVYVDGRSVNAADLETGSNLPDFVGAISITQNTVS